MPTPHQLPEHWRKQLPRIAGTPPEGTGGAYPSLNQVLLALRDMPYARPRAGNTAQACVAEWTGTCSAKHLAAHEWLRLMGYQPRLWMASYRMDFGEPYFSDRLRAQATNTPVIDVHNFLTCDLGGGEIVIDITFPAHLARRGFPVTQAWDGKSSFTLCCSPLERIALDSVETADRQKRVWLRALNSDVALSVREAAIVELMQQASGGSTSFTG